MPWITGQRIGDLLTLEWSAIGQDGITFRPAKISKTTRVAVLIQWTPRLREVVERLKLLKREKARFVIVNQEGRPYKYHGVRIAWDRALERAKIQNAHIHDLRAKALTDKDRAEGMGAARTMGGHSTEHQTAGYVRHRTAKKTSATR